MCIKLSVEQHKVSVCAFYIPNKKKKKLMTTASLINNTRLDIYNIMCVLQYFSLLLILVRCLKKS